MNISKPSLDIRKSVLIQSDFPKKLTINRNSLNMVYLLWYSPHFTGNMKVFIKIWTNEHHFKKNTSRHPDVFPLISNAPVTLAMEITRVVFSQVFIQFKLNKVALFVQKKTEDVFSNKKNISVSMYTFYINW